MKLALTAANLVFASSFALTPSCDAAEITLVAGKTAKAAVQVSGEIVAGDADKFIDLVKRANAAGKLVANVRLNSMGGNLLEGVQLADAIRTAKISTNVGRTSVCASACFLAFAAGESKFVTYGAQVGVHGASDQSGRETVQSGAATVSMARVAKDLGVPAAIIGRMVVTPPSDVVWLSPQDLQSMGVSMVGKPQQMNPPVADGSPIQQIPGPPTSLAPGTSDVRASTTTKMPTWNEFVDSVTAKSASQNSGRPRYFRMCQPEFKVCITGINYVNSSGKEMSIKVVKDMKDMLVSREVCEFNAQSDVRVCSDWDKGTTHRDMQNVKGEWQKVADE